MSTPENQPAPAETPLPARREQVRTWLKVYVAGSVLFPAGMTIYGIIVDSHNHPVIDSIFSMLVMVVFFPITMALLPVGLASVFGCLLAACIHGEWHPTYNEEEMWWPITIPLAYGIFVLHMHLTDRAKTRRAFLLLMVSLVLLVTSSLIGCVRECSQPLGLQ